jgi:hypothetical protein
LKLNKLDDRSDDLNFVVQHEFLGLIRSMVTKADTSKSKISKKQEENIRRQLFNRIRRPEDRPENEVDIE